jgi:hypothetical protein
MKLMVVADFAWCKRLFVRSQLRTTDAPNPREDPKPKSRKNMKSVLTRAIAIGAEALRSRPANGQQ